ncbi:Nramp family divalent metal transporter [Hyphomonas johnsonii]|uniref:Mn2+/Fe2+ transporter n=1 Tax=Hyphomonas johnsonii MHS-2 TaxID=1280950 RepID=A0A059FVF2_9PROT|nr:Nramp family divalent metal transporter [Hyphomonas johnsonii]KCZ94680.1 Mn2+/Fe2+ transporter [Hyphomonas johnsonii MHS-2]
MKLPIGPGALVAAAFIGPGTVTVCTLAGANFGFALVWALVFATFATIILQDMAARLGVMGRVGLGEALVSGTENPWLKWGAAGLVLTALALGNAAYEAGNLSGAALGIEALAGEGTVQRRWIILLLALIAGTILIIGRYKLVERVLISLVMIMSLAFAGSAILVRPDIASLLSGIIPRVPEGGLLTAVALIGTTIVPYNLFLHAAAVRERWPVASDQALGEATTDTRVSIGLGGLISILILTTAAASLFGSGAQIDSAAGMADAIAPTYGAAAKYLVAIGFFAAGLTSSITAPLATAYALSEIARQPRGGPLFRGVALAVLVIGTGIALLGLRPVQVILVAQVANGLLLPIVAVFLLIAMNRRSLLGDHVNGRVANALGVLVILITFGLGLRIVLRAVGVWP